jgi:hypothetical protein
MLVGGARNLKHPAAGKFRSAWQAKLSNVSRSWFRPDEPLTPELLLSWLGQDR